jgi:hypothetical protein
MAAGAGWVASWRIVGAGYLWIAGGTALLAGAFAAFGGGWATAATGVLLIGILLARRPRIAAMAYSLSGALYIAHAIPAAGPVFAITGALALGGTTCEMLLGHWYLVDPTLPRWALRRLDALGTGGLLIDTGLVLAAGTAGVGTAFVLPWTHLGLAGLSVLLMVGVWFSLKEKGYEGVMAATGLSYLAVLTTLGAVSVARLLLAG